MKLLTLLEVGDLGALVVIIILTMLFIGVAVSAVVAVIAKIIYEWNNDRQFSRKQFIQTMVISLLVCGLISGYICGGGL
ncbi:hypothetical protein MUU74_05065 [Chryseobacterium daecheongense]|uniref:hypothetical protein n=1 Tax=Chryseobacterium daecheongense TaxID=192389 RepID=UPI001FD6EADD|nr:hypothetical protein [Chryseobacterium daecheongense]UOU99330.1 hypothetical protein MUU74_05065 [Chryseobacterium daecheongense]